MGQERDGGSAARADPATEINDRESFAAALDQILRTAPLSLRDLAARTGTSSSTISGWRRGRHLPYPRQEPVLEKLLGQLGVSDPRPWLDGLVRARAEERGSVGPNPYRGLEPFTEDDSAAYFGRDDLVDELWQRVQEQLEGEAPPIEQEQPEGEAPLVEQEQPEGEAPPIVLVGASGSGKTSALRAGLVATARRRSLEISYLAAEPDAPPPATVANRVIVIDQFETVLSATPERAASYIGRLERLQRAQPAVVVIGLRADHYHIGLEHDYLARGLRRPVIPDVMTDDRVADCIELPAQRANMTVEPQLTRQLLSDFGRHARGDGVGEVLPLLSHVLYRLVEQPGGPPRQLTLARYRDVGGLTGALRETADEAYRSLDRPGRCRCQQLLTSLVEIGRDSLPVRRPAPLSALRSARSAANGSASRPDQPEMQPDWLDDQTDEQADQPDDRSASGGADTAVIETFVNRRLLTVERDTVTISHEVLLRAWPQLRRWIDDRASSLRSLSRIRAAHEAWESNNRDPGSLLAGAELETASSLAQQPWARSQLDGAQRAFIIESARVAARRRRTRRWLVQGLAVAALAAAVLAAVALTLAQRAQQSSDEAMSRQLSSQSLILRDRDPSLSTQLAIASYAQAPTVEARSAVIAVTALMPSERYLGQPGPTALAASADGSRLAYSDSVNGQIVVMDRSSDGYRRTATLNLNNPEHDVYGMAMSADGGLVAFGGTDHYANLWDVERGRTVVLDDSLTNFSDPVQSVLFSPDGTEVLASGTSESGVGRWQVGPGPTQLTEPVIPAAGSVMAIAVDPALTMMATGDDSGLVQLWDLGGADDQPLWSFMAEGSPSALAVAVSPDGQLLAAGFRDGTMMLWDIADPAAPAALDISAEPFGSWTTAVAFSPSGRRFMAASSDGQARFWDVAGWEQLGGSVQHPTGVTNALLVDDDSALISLSDGSVRTWQLDHEQMASLQAPIWSAEHSPDGAQLLAMSRERAVLWAVGDDGRLTLLDRHLRLPDPKRTATGEAAWSPDGDTIAAGTFDGSVLLLTRTERGFEATSTLDTLGSLIEAVAFTPDGSTLAAAANDGIIGLWRLDDQAGPAARAPAATIELSALVINLAIDPSGSVLAVTTSEGELHLYRIDDPGQPRQLATVAVADDSASGIAFHPTEPIVAIGSHDSTVSLWDVRDASAPTLITRISGPNGRIHDVTFAPDGDLIAASTSDGAAWLWDVGRPSAPELSAKLNSGGALYTLSFAPSGDALIGAGTDELVSSWMVDAERAISGLCRNLGDRVTEIEWHDLVPGVPYRPPCPAGD